MKILQMLLLVAIVITPRAVAAQAVDTKSEASAYVFAMAGRGGFGAVDDGAPTFGGWMFGGGGGLNLAKGWFVGGVVDRLASYSSNESDDRGDVTAFLARVGHRWGNEKSRFRPYVSYAIGIADDRFADTYGEYQYTGAVMGAVFGGDISTGDRFFVRPEVSVMGGMGEVFTRASVGLGVKFK